MTREMEIQEMWENSADISYDYIRQVKEDLKTKNRFSCDKKFEEILERYAASEHNTVVYDTNTRFYRARVYKKADAEGRYRKPPRGRFKGFDAKDSFICTDNERIVEGRCNPAYIPYLYTSLSEKCCIHEVRPAKEAYVSVATIKAIQPLKILFFDKTGQVDGSEQLLPGVSNATLFLYLAKEFSRSHKEFGDYIFCQYVSEKVKLLGFDGVSFYSAVCPKPSKGNCKVNMNVVVFNYEKCKATSSKLYYVTDVEITYF